MTRAARLAPLLALLAATACSTASEPTNEPDPTAPTSADGGTLVGSGCTSDDDCGGLRCTAGKCFAATASDGTRNGGESDVDCGGPVAPKCGDGKTCGGPGDCASGVCTGSVCAPPSPTDGVVNGGESDVDCGGPVAPKCADGKACAAGGDCASAVCGADKTCAAPTHDDGAKNGDETDVDCGGATAPKCAAGKTCLDAPDCDSRFCTDGTCEPRKAGRKDGDESDVDCGGTVAPKCDWGRTCLADADCTSSACGQTGLCVEGPSCKALHGGVTCGSGEVGEAGAVHESCCRSLPVAGYTDPREPGKTVYLDKYEITAGRMRAFLDFVTAQMGGPNVKAWMAAHRPARWNAGWENTLPAVNVGQAAPFTVTNPTANLLYPGQDRYLANNPTQSSWSVVSGDYVVDPGVYHALGAAHFFPEYRATVPPWPTVDYAATHNLNCTNTDGAYGLSTYWFPPDVVSTYSGGVGKAATREQMDVKALNCSPFGLYAALCAWDGGQLATVEVMDRIGGANQVNFRVAGAIPSCAHGINSAADTPTGCYGVYYYPAAGDASRYDDSARVAPPGRIPADEVRLGAGDEPWRDLKGNLLEAVLKADLTFDWRGYGMGYSSSSHHRNQGSTPRMKGGSFGARCMRFR